MQSDYRDLENVTSSNQQEKTLNEIVPLLKSSFPVIDKNNEQHFYERLLKVVSLCEQIIDIKFGIIFSIIQIIFSKN